MSGGDVAATAAGVLAGCALLLAARPRVRPEHRAATVPPGSGRAPGVAEGTVGRARRVALPLLAGVGAQLFLGGLPGTVAGLVAAGTCWRVLARAEPAAVRRARVRASRDLPHLVGLMAAGLRAGAPPEQALAAACAALPGAAADALAATTVRLALGVDPTTVWAELARSGPSVPGGGSAGGSGGVAVLGRTLSRAHTTGAAVRDTVEALADQLASEARASTEDRARAVGVRAALPLGLCLLPSFLLLGIVPVVAGLAARLGTG